MDLTRLEHLASEGFVAVGPDEFGDLWRWCWDWCEATGDGRFCTLADLLRTVDQWWDECQVVPTTLARAIEQRFMEGLPAILAADTPQAGCHFARLLRQETLGFLKSPEDWPA